VENEYFVISRTLNVEDIFLDGKTMNKILQENLVLHKNWQKQK